ncbi:hypothetical protein LJC63_08030 [Ruminococcaceae bacterium OttesenSCG-928-L11]|nr:hypothetical protein [Ruminococcaceae bacterium OttesenSCG-928-L11]
MSTGRIRQCNFSMRLREEQDALLNARKDEYGMTISEYLRTLILFASAFERPRSTSEFAAELYRELNCIGNCINDTAHAVNGRRKVIPTDLESLEKDVITLFSVYDRFIRDRVKNPY